MDKDNYILSIDCDWVQSPRQFQQVVQYFIEKIKDVEEVYFTEEHQFHYPHVPENVILVNIDDHHDLGYKDYHYSWMDKGILDEASWVFALIRYKKLKGYIWISNYNSHFSGNNQSSMELNYKKVRALSVFKRYYEIEKIKDLKYSRILVCESYDWSDKSKYLYSTLIEIAKICKKKIIYDDPKNCKALIKV